MHLREHDFLVIGLVVAAFHIDFQEAVENDLGSLQCKFLASLVRRYLDIGTLDLGISHLRGDGALPYKIVEFLLLGRTFDGRILYIGRTYGLVRLLSTFGMRLVLSGLGVFLTEIVQNECLGSVYRKT